MMAIELVVRSVVMQRDRKWEVVHRVTDPGIELGTCHMMRCLLASQSSRDAHPIRSAAASNHITTQS
jgi:hypothetical protein